MEYIASRVEAFRAGSTSGDDESILLGEVVAKSAEELMETSTSEDSPEVLDDEVLYVEIGDTISYHEAGNELDIRRVTIVRGKDDPGNAIINDYKPLAVALLGAEVGETVTLRQPTSELDIVVDRIERSESEVREPTDSRASTSMDGINLAPYPVWRGHAADPRTASLNDAADTLWAIVDTEGSGLGDSCVPDLCACERYTTLGTANAPSAQPCARKTRAR